MKFTTFTGILALKHKVLRVLMLLSVLLLLPMALYAQSAENAYALWMESTGTLKFLLSANEYKPNGSHSGATITKVWSGDQVLNTPTDAAPGWKDIKSKIKTIIFDESFKKARPKSIAYWFDNSSIASASAGTLKEIVGIEYLNTSEVVSMNHAFFRCTHKDLIIDISHFVTTNVTDMTSMFAGCSLLTALDLSNFNTASVVTMSGMFSECSALTSLNISGFVTTSVTNMSQMFYKCISLADIDLSSFNTANVTTFESMFNNCSSLKELDLTNFDASNVTTAKSMFESCSNLKVIRADADWRNISIIDNMFSGCTKLQAVGNDKSRCKYASGKNLPFACTNGEGYFTSISGYLITFYGNDADEIDYQIVDKGVTTVALQKYNESVLPPPTDKIFGSWNTVKGGTGALYFDEDQITITDNIDLYAQWGKDISGCDITINPKSFTFTGSECKPSAIVEDNFTKLSLNTDFVLSYSNNINAGSDATIIIRGKGYYAGTITEKFTIKPADLSAVSVSPQRQVLAFSGNEQAPTFILRNGNTKLVEGTDYTISGNTGHSAVGDYEVTFEGQGNYTGKTTVTYTISSQKAYAVWTEGNQTLTFLLAEDDISVGSNFNGQTVTAVWSGDDVLNSPKDNVPAWNATVANQVKYITIDATFSEASPKSIAYWFANVTDLSQPFGTTLQQIKNIEYLNTEAVTSMRGAFLGCGKLKKLEVSKFATDLVTDMQAMFHGCSTLTKLDVKNFVTDNVTDMSYMFDDCEKLTVIPTENFDTRNVIYMNHMFANCSSLTKVAISGFNTEKVENMMLMFAQCSSLTDIDLSGFITTNVKNMVEMFEGCKSLTSINVSGFKTENVEQMSLMFMSCTGLTSLDLSKFNTAKVKAMSSMFEGCTSLTSLNISSFNTSEVEWMNNMFKDCPSLTKIDVSKFNTAKVTTMSEMFSGCSAIKELDLRSFDFGAVKYINGMFANCTSLATIRTKAGLDCTTNTNIIDANGVFTGSTALVGVGSDGSICKYDPAIDAPKVCKEGVGYFTADDIWVITFDNNIDNKLEYQVVAKPSGSLVKVKLQPNTFTNDSYNFVEWCTKADGTGSRYKDEEEITLTGNVTLYARWGKDIKALCEATSSIKPGKYTYTGKNVFPAQNDYVIMDGSKTLVYGTDFLPTRPTACKDVNADGYEVEIVGQGEYAGSFVLTYKIEPYNFTYVTIEPEDPVLLYNGDVQVPTFTLKDDNGNTLQADVDYTFTVDPANPKDGGTYTVEFEGKGNYYDGNYTTYSIKNAFAVWTESNSTLTFTFSGVGYTADPSGNGLKTLNSKKVTAVWQGDDVTNSAADVAWAGILDKVTAIEFDESFADVRPKSTASWFAGATQLVSIYNIENLNTTEVTNMSKMFEGCKKLTSIDLNALKTPAVTDMSNMFDGCAAITELNVKSFNPTKVTNMNGMFANCTSLTRIYSNSSTDWRKSNPTMDGMFANDTQLAGIGNGTYCLYDPDNNYPYVCQNGKGYFTADDVYIITYDDNLGGTPVYQSVLKTTTAPVKLRANTFEKSGYVFVNWNTAANGDGTSYDDASETRITEDITLYAMWKRDIAAADIVVTFDPAEPVFTGSAVTPTVTLKDGDYTLVEGKDYGVFAYYENINASTTKPYVTIRGKGNYTSSVSKHFTIKPYTLTNDMIVITSGSTDLAYNKAAQAPGYDLYHDSKQLVVERDYTMSPTNENIDVKEYEVTFTGAGNYTGEITTKYHISPRDIDLVTISPIADAEYNGAAVTPEVEVKDGDYTLELGKDFTTEYSNNTNAGNGATVTIKGINNYKNTKNATFNILPLDFAKITVTPQNAQLPFNSKEQNPVYTLTFGENVISTSDYTITGDLNKKDVNADNTVYTVTFTPTSTNYTGSTTATYTITKCDLSAHAKVVFDNDKNIFTYTGSNIVPNVTVTDDFGNTLVLGTDYELAIPESKEIGTYNVTATGKGNYEGQVNGEYRIVEKSLEDAVVVVDDATLTYTGSAIVPTTITVTLGGETLTQGSDYTVSYDNNINAGSSAKVIINGLGKYNGSVKEALFTIHQQDISSATVVANDSPAYTGEAQVSTFTVTDANGLPLTADTDYTVGDYSNNKSAGEQTVVLSGIGNYTGTVNGVYNIGGKSIENYIVTIDDDVVKEYTGAEQSVNISVCEDVLKQYCLVKDQDYIVEYDNNVNVGKATVHVKGKGNFYGETAQKAEFDIVAMPYTTENIAITAEKPESATMPEIPYTGEPQMPEYVVTDKYGNTLAKDVDYTADYSANKEVGGPYSVVLNFKGNYSGQSAALQYMIMPRGIKDVQVVFVNENKEFTYTGSAIKAVKEITDLGTPLVEGTHYSLAYETNVEPGENTAKVTITGLGAYAGGTRTETFTIKKIEMSAVKVEMSESEFTYDGSAQKPTFKLTDPNNHELAKEEFTVSGDDGNEDVGSYTVTFKAAENSHYTGSTTAKYSIVPDVIDPKKVTVAIDQTDFVYNGQAQQPDVTVEYNGSRLSAETDYDVEFGDNVNAGTVSVTVTGKGNYSGFSVSGDDYTIQPRPIAKDALTADKNKFTYNGESQKPVLTVVGVDNAKLVADQDYVITLPAETKNAGTYTAKVECKGNYKGTLETSFTIEPYDLSNCVIEFKDGISEFVYSGFRVKPEIAVKLEGFTPEYEVSGDANAINVGTYKLVVTGTGNFKGEKTANYTITARDISATVE
ncbi:MAG: BspA family leucine-rich repeat surface protein, partial [Bacteroidales bacterium]|nr:BspA family leucine-rich repeat surface protein [Bacteroidales bacterium]